MTGQHSGGPPTGPPSPQPPTTNYDPHQHHPSTVNPDLEPRNQYYTQQNPSYGGIPYSHSNVPSDTGGRSLLNTSLTLNQVLGGIIVSAGIIGAIFTYYSDRKVDIASIHTSLTTINTNITNINNDLNRIREDIDKLKYKISSESDNINKTIITNEHQRTLKDERVNSSFEGIQQKYSSLVFRINRLEERVKDDNHRDK